ncbi:Glucagon receptor, partial [Nibea albiflora]
VSGRTAADTLAEWNRYRNECLISMSTDPRPEGVTCSRMFDMYACWSDGKPNSTVKVPCPWYLPWKLHCTRNYIHINLFASFILRAASILTRDALLSHDTEFKDDRNISDVLSGTPVLFVIPWIVVRYLFENTRCWEINENKGHWWIIRTPILLAILVNFFIFIHIILILVSKLKAHQMRYTDYKFRLAKSTLTLIPLLGIHEVVFAVLTVEHIDGVLGYVSLFFHLFLNSFQGLLVAILYCFINKEVQAEMKKKWQRWKLGTTYLDDLRNTGSNTPQVGTSMPLSMHPSPCLPPAHCLENNCLLPQPYTHQAQLEATQPETYCCMSALRQDGGGGNEDCESYC